jgi:negative regulator of flagellin synthesis FlgM
MKIGPLESKPVTPAVANDRKGGAAGTAAAGVTGGGEPSTRVALSPAAKALATANADATFDAGKVERVAQAIRDGKFEINAEAIADKLIANAQEVLARTTR